MNQVLALYSFSYLCMKRILFSYLILLLLLINNGVCEHIFLLFTYSQGWRRPFPFLNGIPQITKDKNISYPIAQKLEEVSVLSFHYECVDICLVP